MQVGGGGRVTQVPPSLGPSSQRYVAGLQTRLPPPHCASSVHCTQTPVGSLQRAVVPEQRGVHDEVPASGGPASGCPASGRLRQVRVEGLQVLPGQCVSSRHSTQYAPLAAVVLQCGLVPLQPAVAVQVTQAPRVSSQKSWPPQPEAQAELATGTH